MNRATAFAALLTMLTMLAIFPAAATPAPASAARAGVQPEATFEPALTALLSRHVRWNADGTNTTVDYGGIRRDRAELQRMLDGMARVPKAAFDRWPVARRQAFLLNAYNAHTLALIADAPPHTRSIRELGNLLRSPWQRKVAPLLGKLRTLDDIEHGLLRGAPDFAEPRIHFAANCASVGCPALRPEAYTAARLDAQLDDQTRRFLRDASRNRVVRAQPLRLEVSSIFDWYEDDFDTAGGVQAFLARYPAELGLDPPSVATLRAGRAGIEPLDYDWRLNAHGVR